MSFFLIFRHVPCAPRKITETLTGAYVHRLLLHCYHLGKILRIRVHLKRKMFEFRSSVLQPKSDNSWQAQSLAMLVYIYGQFDFIYCFNILIKKHHCFRYTKNSDTIQIFLQHCKIHYVVLNRRVYYFRWNFSI